MPSSNLRKRNATSSQGGPKPPQRKRQNTSGQSRDVKVEVEGFFNQNTKCHHTDEYENADCLVLRRGGTFKIGLNFEGLKFSEIKNTVLRFSIDSSIGSLNNTSRTCKVVQCIDKSKWEMVISESKPNQLMIVLEINIPVSAMIGRYKLDIIVPSSSGKVTFSEEFGVIILFNPWNEDDEVYLSDDELREEYVVKDVGCIYRGSSGDKYYGPNIGPKKWIFGQFEEDILNCVLELLEKREGGKKSSLKRLTKERSSSVWISRIISAVLNSSDNEDEPGVLEGNWSGDYEDGRSPSSWNGSVEIFQKYYRTKQSVKYGQCWVFSGIMTTALRALGIPARSVTNFDSAHDTDQTMTIDKFYDEDGDPVDDLCDDSVWNFHVWNEIWTKRKDLPGDSYDGWQAVDSTPQEQSANLYQMGPAPLKAIKEGEIFAGFDSGFVFGEVNADRVSWVVNYEGIVQKMKSKSTGVVGQYISTKKVGEFKREDITHLYKYQEGSSDERRAFKTAYSFGKGPQAWTGELDVEEEGKDLTIDLSTKAKTKLVNGESFTCVVTVKNTSNQRCTVDLIGVIRSATYSGMEKMLIRKENMNGIVIDAGKSASREINVKPEEYLGKLTEHNSLKFVVVAKVPITGKLYVDDMTFTLNNGEECIDIKVVGPLKVNKRSKIEVTFTNPLPVALHRTIFTLEGAKVSKALTKTYRRKQRAYSKKKVSFYVTPKKAGVRHLLVDVDSAEQSDFKGSAIVKVLEA